MLRLLLVLSAAAAASSYQVGLRPHYGHRYDAIRASAPPLMAEAADVASPEKPSEQSTKLEVENFDGVVKPTKTAPVGVVEKFDASYWASIIAAQPKVSRPKDMSAGDDDGKGLMQKVKDAGSAGIISYIFWEWAFWGVSVPVAIGGFYQLTGHWPDLSNQEDMAYLGGEAFAFVNVARFAVPLRVGLALSTTPWVKANVVDRFEGWFKKEGE